MEILKTKVSPVRAPVSTTQFAKGGLKDGGNEDTTGTPGGFALLHSVTKKESHCD